MHISTYLFGGHFEGRRAHFNYIWNNCWLWVTDLYVSIYDPTCQATDESHWYGWLCATSYLLMSAIVSIFGAHFCRWWDPSVFRKVVNVRTIHRLISWQNNIHSIDRIYQTTSQECKSRPETTKKPSVDRFWSNWILWWVFYANQFRFSKSVTIFISPLYSRLLSNISLFK